MECGSDAGFLVEVAMPDSLRSPAAPE
jgi:hypothetical protein